MPTREIPRDQWERYFDSLSNRAHLRPPLVTVSIEGEELGAEPVAEHAPLRSIFYEEKGSEGHSLDIEVGDDVSGDRLVQRVEAQSVWVEESPRGDTLALDIEGMDRESRTRIKTVIRFER